MERLLLLICIACSYASRAQMAASFDEAKSSGVRVSLLDSTYKSAVNVDKKKAVFAGKEDKLVESYNGMLQDLGDFLAKHNFKWDTTTRCFNRIYFNKDGHIDFFLYSFKTNISSEKEAQFKRLLNEFIRQYKFPLHAKVNFAQCSPVIYQS